MKHSPLLVTSLALAAIGSSLPTSIALLKGEPKCAGFPIGCGEEPNKPFTDSRGRKYVRDEKGTIRKVIC